MLKKRETKSLRLHFLTVYYFFSFVPPFTVLCNLGIHYRFRIIDVSPPASTIGSCTPQVLVRGTFFRRLLLWKVFDGPPKWTRNGPLNTNVTYFLKTYHELLIEFPFSQFTEVESLIDCDDKVMVRISLTFVTEG